MGTWNKILNISEALINATQTKDFYGSYKTFIEQDKEDLINDIVNHYIMKYQNKYVEFRSNQNRPVITLFKNDIDCDYSNVNRDFIYDNKINKFKINFTRSYRYKKIYMADLTSCKFYQSNIARAINFSYRDLNTRYAISYNNFINNGKLTKVKLSPEPNNKHSKFAIAVYSNNFKIGYVKMKDNEELYNLLQYTNKYETAGFHNDAYFIKINDLKEISLDIKEFYYKENVFSEILSDKIQDKFQKLLTYQISQMHIFNNSEEMNKKNAINSIIGKTLFNEYNKINNLSLRDEV